MNLIKSKKAMDAYDIVYWSMRILFVLIMLFFIYFLARTYESKTLDTSEQEAQIFVRYMLYNQNALSYYEPTTGRAYSGIIDLSKLNAKQIEESMSFGVAEEMIAANITLLDSTKANVVSYAYYNQEKYENWLPLAAPTFFGIGTINRIEETRYILYRDAGRESKPGFIRFEVLVPRT